MPNYLAAVFWDYPQFASDEDVRDYLKDNPDPDVRLWVLRRFLSNGRAVDVFRFFEWDEIASAAENLPRESYTAKKWYRLLEVYGQI